MSPYRILERIRAALAQRRARDEAMADWEEEHEGDERTSTPGHYYDPKTGKWVHGRPPSGWG